MKTAVIMQPTYLPWSGYFDLMDQSDVFVFLDSVQFKRRSWQQRNRIKSASGDQVLTVPVLSRGKRGQKICEVKIERASGFTAKHLKSLQHCYARTDFFSKYRDDLAFILNRNHEYLVDLNIEMVTWLKSVLGIRAEMVKSSSFGITERRTHLLLALCQELGADRYLSPLGSKAYLDHDAHLFAEKNIVLEYQSYKLVSYKQLFGAFIPCLSVMDLLFNEGDRSLSIIRASRTGGRSSHEALVGYGQNVRLSS